MSLPPLSPYIKRVVNAKPTKSLKFAILSLRNDNTQQLRKVYVYFHFNIDITRYMFTIFSIQYSHTFLYFEHTNKHAASMAPCVFMNHFLQIFGS